MATVSTAFIGDPDTWQWVSDTIGDHDYTYDLSDSSHRMDVVQIVCQALVKVAETD